MIKQIKRMLWIFLILISACSPTHDLDEVEISLLPTLTKETNSNTPTSADNLVKEPMIGTPIVVDNSAPEFSPASPPSAMATFTPIATVEEVDSISFETRIESNCHSEHYKELSEIGLNKENLLLFSKIGDVTGGIWFLTKDSVEPQLIANTNVSNGDHFVYQGVSPDGYFILYYKWRGDDFLNTEVWMSSIESQEQKLLTVVDADSYYRANWLSNELVLLTSGVRPGYPYNGAVSMEYLTMEMLNISDSSVEELPLLPEGAIPLSLTLSPIADETSTTIYFQDAQLYLHNFLTGTADPIFSWLNSLRWLRTNPENIYSDLAVQLDENDNFDLLIRQPYGFDFALDIDFKQATNSSTDYATVMKPISLLNDEFEIIPIRWITRKNQLIFWKYPTIRQSLDPIEYQLFMIDLDEKIIHDYCVTQAGLKYPQVSSDGKFLGWTDDDTNSEFQGTILLNLETGEVARLAGWRIQGWGKSVTEP